jgi:hypothetical protein
MRLNVYVPAPGRYTPIEAGSGIVGVETHDQMGEPTGSVVVDYEGNFFGAANIVTWADRIHHAASRHVNRYPTTARSLLPADHLIAVGIYDYERGTLIVPGEHEARIAAWLGIPAPDLRRDLLRPEMFRSGR